MATKRLPPRKFLREALDYDPDTGEFRWRTRPVSHFPSAVYHRRWNSKLAGKPAGTITSEGYRQIHLWGCVYFAHRIAWAIVHGKPMPVEIDHVDGNRLNNRIANLRAATSADNKLNRPATYNATGVKGVRFSKGGRFSARIQRHRLEINLGTFDTLEEAAEARREAADRLHGVFVRHE